MSIVAASIPISKQRFNVKRVLAWWPVLPLAVFVLLAVFGPQLVPFDPERALGPVSTPPNATYHFGTDRSGMDVFSRTIVATRLNLTIAVSVTLFATVAGSVKRGVAGFVARGASRTLDLVQAVPVLLIGLVAVAFFGRNSGVMIVTIAVLLLPNQARLVRNETLRVRSEAYLDAARLAGASELTLTRRHVLPNAIGPAINNMSVISALAIIITAGLGFVGAGVQPPTPEWGTMLSIGSQDVQAGRWWAAFFPAAFLALCVAAVSMANGVFMRQRRR
jgi:peptide/nickel transport system permease protein